MSEQTFSSTQEQLLGLFDSLMLAYGHQHWWPADSRFEVMVGAVLTQNTAWVNVEKAIANLRAADVLSAEKLLTMSPSALAGLIRPSGYYNIKAQRLRNLCLALLEAGGESSLEALSTSALRRFLLSINGVGPETADDILLYGFARPVFVIDAYTRRLLQRLGMVGEKASYESLRSGFEAALPADVELFREYHALIVQHAKQACARQPGCLSCVLIDTCPSGRDQLMTV